jgi:pseudouridylate synthase / pseudouridine kinase
VIFNPIPTEHAIPFAEIEVVIQEAVQQCNKIGIIGKDITPFLLKRVVEATKGRSLEANLGLIRDNARVGADIAVKLASLDSPTSFQPPPPTLQSDQTQGIANSADLPVEIMVIGAMAVDLTCTLPSVSIDSFQLHTSLPSRMHTSAGGVAHNVALATAYASSKSVRLVTALGPDPEGSWLRDYASTVELDVSFILGVEETARYVAIHDQTGELITAAADMKIIEDLPSTEIRKSIREGKPKYLGFDGNLSPSSIQAILEETANLGTKGSLIPSWLI